MKTHPFFSSIKIPKSFRWFVLLFFILFLATWLRLTNTYYATNVDEPNVMKRAVQIADGQWHIRWYNWPAQSLMRLNAAPVRIAAAWFNYQDDSQKPRTAQYWYEHKLSDILVIGHVVTTIFAIFSIIVMYQIGVLLRDQKTGVIAALFLSVSSLHVLHSHFATPDVPMSWAMLAVLWCALQLLHLNFNDQKKQLLLSVTAGAVIGFAVATKYTGVMTAVPLFLVAGVLLYRDKRKYKKIAQLTIVTMLAAIVVHMILNPFFFVDFVGIVQQIQYEAGGDRLGVDFTGERFVSLRNLWFYVSGALLWNGTTIALLGYGSIIAPLCVYRTKKNTPLRIFALYYIIFLVALSLLQLHWSRWSMPLVTLLPLFAAISVSVIWDFALQRFPSYKKSITSIFCILLFLMTLPQLVIGIMENNQWRAKTTDAMVLEYITSNHPVTDRFFSDTYYVHQEPYYVSQRRIDLYAFSFEELLDQDIHYVVVKPSRLTNAQKKPDAYPDIIRFFHSLETRGELLYTARDTCSNILQKKRDDQFFSALLLQGRQSWRKNFTTCETGATIQVYRIQ